MIRDYILKKVMLINNLALIYLSNNIDPKDVFIREHEEDYVYGDENAFLSKVCIQIGSPRVTKVARVEQKGGELLTTEIMRVHNSLYQEEFYTDDFLEPHFKSLLEAINRKRRSGSSDNGATERMKKMCFFNFRDDNFFCTDTVTDLGTSITTHAYYSAFNSMRAHRFFVLTAFKLVD